jgi:hypothetical protein
MSLTLYGIGRTGIAFVMMEKNRGEPASDRFRNRKAYFGVFTNQFRVD